MNALLAPFALKRQEEVAKAIDVCIREGKADLFVEWHQFWKPEKEDNLWSVEPGISKAGVELFGKRRPAEEGNVLEDQIAALAASDKHRFHDSPDGFDQRRAEAGVWHVRASKLRADQSGITFASVAGPIRHGWATQGRFFALGSAEASLIRFSLLCSDGNIQNGFTDRGLPRAVRVAGSVVVCRGNFCGSNLSSAVVLVVGDIDLSGSNELKDSLIRAAGEIHLPKNVKPVNCTIEAHAKNATAPYKFFELTDVGLSVADDEEGMVVLSAKPDTPFGNCGLAKGDVILAIDDTPAGHSEEFRRLVRRALVRQGDCLVTVVRAGKTLDLPVFFPLPK